MSGQPISLKSDILKRLILIRLTEQVIARRYPEQTMKCPIHLCLGQESTGAVFGALAKPEDLFFGNYRSHGHYLGKGGNLLKLFLELLGSMQGCSGGIGGSMHLVDQEQGFAGSSAIVASTVPQAAGAALAFKYRGLPHGVVVFLGDAAVEQGATYETVNFSLLHQLPLIFVCENNRLAINTKIEIRSCTTELGKRFSSMGLPFMRVSGRSLHEMISAAQVGFSHIRSGKGPFFVECEMERWAVHVGPAHEGPVDLWWQDPENEAASSCPVADAVLELLKNNTITRSQIRKLHDDTLETVEETFARAMKMSRAETPELENLVFSSGLLSSLPEKGSLEPSQLKETVQPSKLANPF